MITKNEHIAQAHVSGVCFASLGKRRVELLALDTHECTFSATCCHGSHGSVKANIWIDDTDGRRFGLILQGEILNEIVEAIKHIKSQSLSRQG